MNETKKIIENRKFLLSMYDVVDYDFKENINSNSPIKFLELSDKEQEALVNYCLAAFVPSDCVLKSRSSYGMKHVFENEPYGFYTYNGQFKGAMLIAGFLPVNPHEMNWQYRVDKGCFGAGGSFACNRNISRQTVSLREIFDLLKCIPKSERKRAFKTHLTGRAISELNYDLNNGGQAFK